MPCSRASFFKDIVPLSPQPLALLIEADTMLLCPIMHLILNCLSLHLQFMFKSNRLRIEFGNRNIIKSNLLTINHRCFQLIVIPCSLMLCFHLICLAQDHLENLRGYSFWCLFFVVLPVISSSTSKQEAYNYSQQ